MPLRTARRPFLLSLALLAATPLWADTPLLWFDADRPTAQAQQAVAILAAAGEDGLDPKDYHAAALARGVTRALQGPALAEAAQAQLDTALTVALQRFLADRQAGRIDPRQIHARFAVQRPAVLDTATLVNTAVSEQRLTEAVRETAPRLPMYDGLRRALAQYRALGDHPAWRAALPLLPGRPLREGQAWAGLPALAQRLAALGDLPADTPAPSQLEGSLLKALQAFQERHGLTPDGVLGAATLQALNVTPAQRARQIELTLERLRWTPYLQAPRMIVVNVPEFTLRAYEVRDDRVAVRLTMKVIVGKALDTRTPLFDEDMRFIEFSPYWNVPRSIARQELVPRLRRQPGYFTQQGFEFVGPGGQVVTALSAAQLDAVLAGRWRIRQRPGPQNALGDIKFVFPNNDNIYLHHTPTPQLFQRDRRDFSHGCIRVEDPVALAQFVLQDEAGWTEARIRAAMEQGRSSTRRLKHPLPVLIAYSTVVVKGDKVFFYADLYDHDQLLDQALRRHSATLPASGLPNSAAE